jgi:hypothetical protein
MKIWIHFHEGGHLNSCYAKWIICSYDLTTQGSAEKKCSDKIATVGGGGQAFSKYTPHIILLSLII